MDDYEKESEKNKGETIVFPGLTIGLLSDGSIW